MKTFRKYRAAAILWTAVLGPLAAHAQPSVVLDGQSLTIDQVVQIAREGASVTVAPQAMERVANGHRLVLAAAAADKPIYGLNRGVGAARQESVLAGGESNASKVRAASERFNRSLLISHSRAMGPAAPVERVRAAMAIRLNTALTGSSGMQVEIARMYADLLNHGITPVIPRDASVGEADIFLLAHVGLTMMGMGDAFVDGQRMPAERALKQAGLKVATPFGKDALAIVSSNAYAAGMASLAVYDAGMLIGKANQVYASSLEAMNGNIAPLLTLAAEARPSLGHVQATQEIADLLQGSYLWNVNATRFIQDPLSFRTAPQLHGALQQQYLQLRQHLKVQLNSSDDNPSVQWGVKPAQLSGSQAANYYVEGVVDGVKVQGAVIPTAHFEPIVWVLDAERLSIGLSHLSNLAMQRSNRMANKNLSGIDLLKDSEPGSLAGFAKPADAIQARIYANTQPLSPLVQPSAGDIEDVGTQAPLVMERLQHIATDACRMLAIEATVANDVLLKREQLQQPQYSAHTIAFANAIRSAQKAENASVPSTALSVTSKALGCAGNS